MAQSITKNSIYNEYQTEQKIQAKRVARINKKIKERKKGDLEELSTEELQLQWVEEREKVLSRKKQRKQRKQKKKRKQNNNIISEGKEEITTSDNTQSSDGEDIGNTLFL